VSAPVVTAPAAEIVAAALEQAAALIEAGHCKGAARQILPGGKRAYCMVGALSAATMSISAGEVIYPGIEIYRWAKAAVLSQLPAPFERMPDYNDATATTTAMVLDVLARAAEAVRSGEVTE